MIVFTIGVSDLLAQNLPAYCEADTSYRNQLKDLGPVVAVGASASSGLMAKDFPQVAANQMCLTHGAGFESHYLFDIGTKDGFLRKHYEGIKPKIVIAIDYLHHASKGRKFDSETREFIDKEIAMLTIDCNHRAIDCSRDGKYYLAATGGYKPVVILGDIYAFYADDCSEPAPFVAETRRDKDLQIENRRKARGCIDEYNKINEYIQQKASETPNLIVVSVDRIFRNLHQGMPLFYDLDGKAGSFYTDDLFWDGFHPWSEPDSQVFANLVPEKINNLITNGTLKSSVTIPYVDIDESYFKPFTGVVLVSKAAIDVYPGKNQRFISDHGEEYYFSFFNNIEIIKKESDYAEVFDVTDSSLVESAGNNPLVLNIKRVTKDGGVVLTDKQLSIIRKVAEDPRNQPCEVVIPIF